MTDLQHHHSAVRRHPVTAPVRKSDAMSVATSPVRPVAVQVRIGGRWHFLARRPRFLYVGDQRQTPRAIGFNCWPGREDRLRVELPHVDVSWEAYWRDIPEARAKVTFLP